MAWRAAAIRLARHEIRDPLPHRERPGGAAVSVLVVGGGPAGLTAALEHAARGADVRVIERRSGAPVPPPRTEVGAAALARLRALGLEEAVRAGAVDAAWRTWHCRTLAEADAGHGEGLASPPGLCVPHEHVAAVLADAVAASPRITVERGALLALDEHPGGVRAVVLDERVAGLRTVAAARVVDATAPGTEGDGVGIVFRAALDALVAGRRSARYAIAHPFGHGTLRPAGTDRWLFTTGGDLTAWPARRIVERLAAATGVPGLDPWIERADRCPGGARATCA